MAVEGGPGRARKPRLVASARLDGPDDLLRRVGNGDEGAFAALYDAVVGKVLGLTRRVLRDPAQAEEVTQEVMVEVWRTATRYESSRGSATAWILTVAHRRAVDRVRAEQARTDRTERVAAASAQRPYDEVAEDVGARLEREQVRRCVGTLTALQREAVTMAYYGGFTYREVAARLGVPLPTVKTRMRDGLLRLRDCLGVDLGERA